MPKSPYFTIGAVARHFGCQPWQIRRAIERGILSEPPRVGAYRVFVAADLPRIEAALRQAGYLAGAEALDA
jgi:DNA-binding transcriptional MerR regulator